MRIFLLLSLFAGLLFTGLSAQSGDSERILKQSQEKLESLSDLKADFTYVISNPSITRQPEPRQGQVRYKSGMYALLMDDQEVYCDLETQWIYLPEVSEVSILDYEEGEGMSLSTIFEIYETNAVPRYEGKETVHGNECHKIFLAIKDPSVDYNQAYLWINTRTRLLEKVSLIDRRQTTTIFEFLDLKTNTGLSIADFRFDPAKHEGVEVYDER
jgi:outer membrane lipoprotein carrier protein